MKKMQDEKGIKPTVYNVITKFNGKSFNIDMNFIYQFLRTLSLKW